MIQTLRRWLRWLADPDGVDTQTEHEIQALQAQVLLLKGRQELLRERMVLMAQKDDVVKVLARANVILEALLLKLGGPVPDDPEVAAGMATLTAELDKADAVLNPPAV